MRAIITAMAVVGTVLALAAPAAAGGAVWDTDRRYYRPGDAGAAETAVAWDHNPLLGTPEDGPYFATLESKNCEQPCAPIAAVRLGEIEVRLGPFEGADGLRYGPNWAGFDFVVPDVPPGLYAIEHCNDPCTTKLGDIVWGELRVLGPPPGPRPSVRAGLGPYPL